jgi:hypothetical protein
MFGVKMRIWKAAVAATLFCCFTAAHADQSYEFVRVSCVPENGMLAVEYRLLHDSVAGYLWKDPRESPKALQKHDLYRARGLDMSCIVGNATYVLKGTQSEETEAHNGACPEVFLDVTRNGQPFFRHVVLGDSCNRLPALMRFTIGENTKHHEPEAEVCYRGAFDQMLPLYQERQSCEWIFGDEDFAKRFPIDEDAIRRVTERVKKVVE